MKKVILLFILLICICFTTSCVKDIEDTNGESTELCYFTDEDILSGKHNVSTVGSFTSQVDNTFTYNVKKMNGIKRLKTLTPKDKSIKIEVNFNIAKGNAKLVLCNDEQIIYTFKSNDSFIITSEYEELKLVIACESCEFKLKYSINII